MTTKPELKDVECEPTLYEEIAELKKQNKLLREYALKDKAVYMECDCVKPVTPKEQTLDTRKEMAFIERVWMEGDNRPYSDMKKAIEALVDKVRSHDSKDAITISRKVAECFLYTRNPATDYDIVNELRNALKEGE